MQEELRERFQKNWQDVPRYIALGRENLDQLPEEEDDKEGEDEEGVAGDMDGDAPVPETAADARTVASFVEDSLA